MPSKKAKASIDWRGYEGNSIILPICPRSPAVQTSIFTASLTALAEQIDNIHLVICDTLDRFNTNDKTIALSNGDAWLERNLTTLSSQFNVMSVTRWEDVRADDSMQSRIDTLTQEYRANDTITQVIDEVVLHYLKGKQERSIRDDIPFDIQAAHKNSVEYLIEEYAGTAIYGERFDLMPEAYWGVYLNEPGVFKHSELRQLETLPITINRLPAPIGV